MKLRKAASLLGILLLIPIGLKLGFYLLGAMWIAGEGSGSITRGFAHVWREQGGIRGFLHIASDLTLARSSDAVIAEHAASRLSTKRQCGKAEGMIELLKSEERHGVQRWLLQALAKCGTKEAIPIFREKLRSDDEMLVIVGAQSLGQLRAREAIPELEELVERCSAQCAGSAAQALALMGESRVSRPWARKVLIAPKPSRDPRSEDSFRRMYAGHVLERVGLPEDIPLLEANARSLGVFAGYHKQAILDRNERR